MQKRFSDKELFEVRNYIPIDILIKEKLMIPCKISEGYFRFLCPVCKEFQTATKSKTNLGRCFRCSKNYNTIDMVMASTPLDFVKSVKMLQQYRKSRFPSYGTNSERFQPLAVNYVGGTEEYYSYAGQIKVFGDVKKTFTILLAYGIGVGPLGISAGCFRINKFGGAEIKVSNRSGSARNLSYVFKSEEEREKAVSVVKEILPILRKEMEIKHLEEFSGEIYEVEFVRRQHHDQFYLYICFLNIL